MSLEVADIFRLNKHKLSYIDGEKWKVVNAITSCRTGKLGAHVFKCDSCDHAEISYNSCRNRHCPKCQSVSLMKWILNRDSELLPVHFHIVFTVPDLFKEITKYNKGVIYNILFKSVSETIKETALNPKNLGAITGFFSILHTWTQKLKLHPHIHCVVPGGGFSNDKLKWIKSHKNYFINVKILSEVFRGKFSSYIEKAFNNNELIFPFNLNMLSDKYNFKNLLILSAAKEWVVYSKPPFKGSFWVVRYLARYTHRIAISNKRLVSLTENEITFIWKDRNKGYKIKQEILKTSTFMHRFLAHVLPHRFTKIRYYGFMGNAHRKENIKLARELLGCPLYKKETTTIKNNWKDIMTHYTGQDPTECTKCENGHLILIHKSFKPIERRIRQKTG